MTSPYRNAFRTKARSHFPVTALALVYWGCKRLMRDLQELPQDACNLPTATIRNKKFSFANRTVPNSTQPALHALRQPLATNAVPVVQRRKRARIEKGVRQACELETCRLHAVAQQRARHCLAKSTNH